MKIPKRQQKQKHKERYSTSRKKSYSKSPQHVKPVDFVVEKLDPLGQGIAYIDGCITFIPRVLPGEKGTARINKKSRGVQFATLETLDLTSPHRVASDCQHYAECNGCDYLHVSYEQELQYKQQALFSTLQPFVDTIDFIEVIKSSQRFSYRNRIQLHYRFKYLGYIDKNKHQVLEVPNCLLPRDELKPVLKSLYKEKPWLEKDEVHGHCEVYCQDDEVKTTWNRSYAEGGFTQVNDNVNESLKNKVLEVLSETLLKEALLKESKLNDQPSIKVIDLFSGVGNLSQGLVELGFSCSMVDVLDLDKDNYHKLDLFEESALSKFWRNSDITRSDLLMVDPPRKGFPLLSTWVKKVKPKYLLYVSCNAVTLARDLKTLQQDKMKIEHVCMLDMFPGTRHYETLVLCKLG